MNTNNHNKIINNVATEFLGSNGLKRERSRLWFDDNMWFLIVVEYQPSSWSKGTYLNVSINFNWNLHNHFSFDYYEKKLRVSEHVEYKSDERFEIEVINMTKKALIIINEYRKFKSINYAKSKLLKNFYNGGFWEDYHKLMILLISYENKKRFRLMGYIIKRRIFKLINKIYANIDEKKVWQLDLKDNIGYLMTKIKTNEIKEHIVNLIIKQRELKKLPFIDGKEIRKLLFKY